MTADDPPDMKSPRSILGPLGLAAALGFGLPWLAARLTDFAPIHGQLGKLYLQHGLQALFALGVIVFVRRWAPGDYGIIWPRGRTYIRAALLGGAVYALVAAFSVVAVTGRLPTTGFPLTPSNVTGWMGFEAIYVGPTEEVLFRGLLIGYLAATVPRCVRLGRFDLSLGGYAAALIFALSHWAYGGAPFLLALGQQVFAFALGLFYAWLFERSGSVLAPVVAHNAGDGLLTLAQIAGTAVG
jgi:membrane protease YdiL (CAAX protease family)